MAQPFDGLPLDTPTVIVDNADIQLIATRTKNGGTVQTVPKPGGPTDLAQQRDARIVAAVAFLNNAGTAAAGVTVTAGNVVAVVQTIVNDLATALPRIADLIESLGKG